CKATLMFCSSILGLGLGFLQSLSGDQRRVRDAGLCDRIGHGSSTLVDGISGVRVVGCLHRLCASSRTERSSRIKITLTTGRVIQAVGHPIARMVILEI